MSTLRPMTAPALKEFLESMRRGTTVEGAAFVAGLEEADLRELRERDVEFAVSWDDAVFEGVDTLTDELWELGVHGAGEHANLALCFTLARRAPHRFGHVVEVDVSPEATPTVEAFWDAYADFAAALTALVAEES